MEELQIEKLNINLGKEFEQVKESLISLKIRLNN